MQRQVLERYTRKEMIENTSGWKENILIYAREVRMSRLRRDSKPALSNITIEFMVRLRRASRPLRLVHNLFLPCLQVFGRHQVFSRQVFCCHHPHSILVHYHRGYQFQVLESFFRFRHHHHHHQVFGHLI